MEFSVLRPHRPHTGEGRYPLPKWLPAFAGKVEFLSGQYSYAIPLPSKGGTMLAPTKTFLSP